MKMKIDWEFLTVLVICLTALGGVGMFAHVMQERNRQQVQINAQREIERTKIEQEAKTTRTKERLKALPWVKN